MRIDTARRLKFSGQSLQLILPLVTNLLITAALITAPFLGASAVQAAPCAPIALSDALIPTFSCTVGDKTFSNFSYLTTPTGAPPSASSVTVTPDGTAPAGEFGLVFSGAFAAPAGTTEVVTIGFSVAASGASITDARLAISGTRNGGTGTADLSETLGNGSPPLFASLPSPPGSLIDVMSFGPTSSLTAMDEAVLVGGSNVVSISSIANDFSETTAVPEPTSLVLLGPALVGLGLFGRRRKQV